MIGYLRVSIRVTLNYPRLGLSLRTIVYAILLFKVEYFNLK